MVQAINLVHVYSNSRSAFIDLEVKRSQLRKSSRSHGC